MHLCIYAYYYMSVRPFDHPSRTHGSSNSPKPTIRFTSHKVYWYCLGLHMFKIMVLVTNRGCPWAQIWGRAPWDTNKPQCLIRSWHDSPPMASCSAAVPSYSQPLIKQMYRKTSNIRRTLVGNKIVDHSDVVGASPVGAAPTTSLF